MQAAAGLLYDGIAEPAADDDVAARRLVGDIVEWATELCSLFHIEALALAYGTAEAEPADDRLAAFIGRNRGPARRLEPVFPMTSATEQPACRGTEHPTLPRATCRVRSGAAVSGRCQPPKAQSAAAKCLECIGRGVSWAPRYDASTDLH